LSSTVGTPQISRIDFTPPPQDFVTDAIFSVDEDLFFSCQDLWAAFAIWRQHPRQMVGFAPRILHEDRNLYWWREVYNKDWGQWRANTIFVTKGGFLHRRYYNLFFQSQFSSLRNAVNAKVTGEDILMSMVHAHFESKPPVPLLAFKRSVVRCTSSRKPLSQLTSRSRRFLQRLMHRQLGSVLSWANFSNFHFFDNRTQQFASLGDTCGSHWVLNSSWWECIRRVWSLHSNSWII